MIIDVHGEDIKTQNIIEKCQNNSTKINANIPSLIACQDELAHFRVEIVPILTSLWMVHFGSKGRIIHYKPKSIEYVLFKFTFL